MKLKTGKINIFINREGTTIVLMDDEANITFAEIKLTPEQLSSALSRVAYTPCEIEVFNLDKIGKKHENKEHIFEIPKNTSRYNESSMELVRKLAQETAPEGWIADNYFGSQKSFFTEGGKHYARTTIRRYI